ncbi:response regulator transcription factor [bacterium]|nr:response regulator transcription factor [bacterium]
MSTAVAGVGIVHTGITTFVIDEHPIIGWALNEYLSRHTDITVLGNAPSADEAMAIIRQKRPHVVIMGASQPDIKCVQAVSSIVRMGTQVVAFCDVIKKEMIDALVAAGGIGFVPKTSTIDDLIKAIESAAQKKRWVSPLLRKNISVEPDPTAHAALTNREREIVVLVAQGLSSKQIADKLFISVNTVESHRKRIFKKLDMHTCAQLVRYAVKEGLMLES